MAMQGKFGWILISNQEKKNALKIIPSHIRNAPNIGHPGGGGGEEGTRENTTLYGDFLGYLNDYFTQDLGSKGSLIRGLTPAL